MRVHVLECMHTGPPAHAAKRPESSTILETIRNNAAALEPASSSGSRIRMHATGPPTSHHDANQQQVGAFLVRAGTCVDVLAALVGYPRLLRRHCWRENTGVNGVAFWSTSAFGARNAGVGLLK